MKWSIRGPCGLILLCSWHLVIAQTKLPPIYVSPDLPTYIILPEDTVETYLPAYKIGETKRDKKPIKGFLVEVRWESARKVWVKSTRSKSKKPLTTGWIIRTENYPLRLELRLNYKKAGQYKSTARVDLTSYTKKLTKEPLPEEIVVYEEPVPLSAQDQPQTTARASVSRPRLEKRLMDHVKQEYSWTYQKINARANSRAFWGNLIGYDIVGRTIRFEGKEYLLFKTTIFNKTRNFQPDQLKFFTTEQQVLGDVERVAGSGLGLSVDLGRSSVTNNFALDWIARDYEYSANRSKIHLFYISRYRASQAGKYKASLTEYNGPRKIENDDLRRKRSKWVSGGEYQQGEDRVSLFVSGLPQAIGTEINYASLGLYAQVSDQRSIGFEVSYFDGQHAVHKDDNFLFGPVIGWQLYESGDLRWYLESKPFGALSFIKDDAQNEDVFISAGLGLGLKQRYFAKWNLGIDLEIGGKWFSFHHRSVDYTFVLTGGLGFTWTFK